MGCKRSVHDVLSSVHCSSSARSAVQSKIPQLGKLHELTPLSQLLTQEVPSSVPKLSAKMTAVTNISFKQYLKRNPCISS